VSKVAAEHDSEHECDYAGEQSKITNDFFVRPAEPTLSLLGRDPMLLLDHGLGRPGHKVISLRQLSTPWCCRRVPSPVAGLAPLVDQPV
jgi:hypothetical protein